MMRFPTIFFMAAVPKKLVRFTKSEKKFWRDVKRTFFVPTVAWKKMTYWRFQSEEEEEDEEEGDD